MSSQTDRDPTSGTSSEHDKVCAECRRLKRRCDRRVPCNNCIQRRCPELCPTGTKARQRPDRSSTALLTALSDVLLQHGLAIKLIAEPDAGPEERGPAEIWSSESHASSSESRVIGATQARRGRYSPYPTIRPGESPLGRFLTSPRHVPSIDDREPADGPSPPQTIRRRLYGEKDRLMTDSLQQPISEEGGDARKTMIPGLSNYGRAYDTIIFAGSDRFLEGSAADSPTAVQTPDTSTPRATSMAFPFLAATVPTTVKSCIAQIPEQEVGRRCLMAYYRYFAWLHSPVSRSSSDDLFERLYPATPPTEHTTGTLPASITWQSLGLAFMILAVGSLYDLEVARKPTLGRNYLIMAEECLTRGGFLNSCSMEGAQTLVLMGHYHMETRNQRGGDSYWQLWGLATRSIQNLECHREEGQMSRMGEFMDPQRLLFWECYTDDVLQANGKMRPSSFHRQHISTLYPYVASEKESFNIAKYQLAGLAHSTLDLTLEHKYFPYAEVLRLDRQLRDYILAIPFNLRCRTAIQAMLSLHVDREFGTHDSPHLDENNLTRTLEQFTLAVLASANFLFLHRPYFARAVQDPEPVKAAFGHSYLAVMEHSSAIVQLIERLYSIFPDVIARHSLFWYHLFAAAASLGSLVINCPSSPLVPFAVSHLDRATQVYGSVRHRLSSGFITQNHQMLCSLKTRIETGSRPAFTTIPGVSLASTSGTLDQYLLDWEKRLVDSHLPVLSAQKDDANSTSAAPPYNPLYPIQLTTSPAPPASMLDASVDTSTDWFQQLWDDILTASPSSPSWSH